MIRIDFHTHTFYSYDCAMQPDKILSLAERRGITHLVVNDHNTIKGGIACKQIEKNYKVQVIIGSEIKTDIGDVTGIFLTEEIAQGPYQEVVRQIKAQGGLSILNHPFVGHKLEGLDFSLFDFIEGYNGRCNEEQNAKALLLAAEHNKPVITGSDAHTYSEVGKNYSEFTSMEDLKNPSRHHYSRTHSYFKIYSQLIKSFKQKNVGLLTSVILSAPRKILLNK